MLQTYTVHIIFLNSFVTNYFKNYCNLIIKWSLNPDLFSVVSDCRARGKCEGKRIDNF